MSMADYYRRDELADYIIDEDLEMEHAFTSEAERMHALYTSKKLSWETKEKDEILVQRMTDDHLINVIKYLKTRSLPAVEGSKSEPITRAWIFILQMEYDTREYKRIKNKLKGFR